MSHDQLWTFPADRHCSCSLHTHCTANSFCSQNELQNTKQHLLRRSILSSVFSHTFNSKVTSINVDILDRVQHYKTISRKWHLLVTFWRLRYQPGKTNTEKVKWKIEKQEEDTIKMNSYTDSSQKNSQRRKKWAACASTSTFCCSDWVDS